MTPHRAAAAPRRPASRGVTLVELMIAIALGLLLVVVIAQLFLGSRQTFATTDDVSRMQDNIRYSQQLLTRTIHLAGYKSQANSATATVFAGNPPIDAPLPLPTGTNPDALTIRYQGSGTRTSAANCQGTPPCTGADGTIVDCLGVRIDAGIIAINTFSIANGANGRPALFCFNGSPTNAFPGVELVPDVRNMQILYGEDLNGDLVADRYVGPEVVAANTANVVSVRVALLFETPTETAKTAPDNQTYDMLGDASVVLGPFADRRIRRVVATTINLRNRTP